MGRGRQRDHSKRSSRRRVAAWRLIMLALIRRRAQPGGIAYSSLLVVAFDHYLRARRDFRGHMRRTKLISLTQFSFNFNSFTDADCLHHFRFSKADVIKIVPVIGLPELQWHTNRGRYSVSPLLSTCIFCDAWLARLGGGIWSCCLDGTRPIYLLSFGKQWKRFLKLVFTFSQVS